MYILQNFAISRRNKIAFAFSVRTLATILFKLRVQPYAWKDLTTLATALGIMQN
jgi:hypothetical protein